MVGETPNLAARLQAAAGPGEVMIASATRRLVGQIFELDTLGPQVLKGLTTPVAMYRVVTEGRAESRFEAPRRSGAARWPRTGAGAAHWCTFGLAGAKLRLDETVPLFAALSGEFVYHFARGDHRKMRELVADTRRLSERSTDPALRLASYRLSAITAMHRGRLPRHAPSSNKFSASTIRANIARPRSTTCTTRRSRR